MSIGPSSSANGARTRPASSLDTMPEDEPLHISVSSLTSSLSGSGSEGISGSLTASPTSQDPPAGFDVVRHYADLLSKDEHVAMPVAAISALSEVIARSDSSTMTELISELEHGAALLRQSSFNPVSLSAGVDLLLRFVTLQRPSISQPFAIHKRNLVARAKEFVHDSHRCVDKIVGFATDMIKDDAVILTHSYSRVVTQTLLHAARQQKRFQVYVTESRPFGLGSKTHALLSRAGIPCQVILDSAVAFCMPKVDIVMLGAEALAENGGLVNFIGSYQMALIAKAAAKPVYALAESFKFLRIFPLNQYDLPTAFPLLQFLETSESLSASQTLPKVPYTPARPLMDSPAPQPIDMTPEQVQNNPLIDYTTPDLISLVISDVGILTPSGVSDTLLRIFSG